MDGGSKADVESGVAKLTQDLGNPETAAAAALAVCMLCERGDPPSALLAVLAPLVKSLAFNQEAVQQNSLSALAGLCALVPGGREELLAVHGPAALVTLLSRGTPAAVKLNALEATGVLAASSVAVDALLLCDAHVAVLGLLEDPATLTDNEAEAAADVLCAFAAMRLGCTALVTAGAVRVAAALLSHQSAELRVRGLLSLGMLAADERGARQLVESADTMRRLRLLAGSVAGEGAAQGTAADSDEAFIAADVLTSLLRHPTVGPIAAAGMAAGAATNSG